MRFKISLSMNLEANEYAIAQNISIIVQNAILRSQATDINFSIDKL